MMYALPAGNFTPITCTRGTTSVPCPHGGGLGYGHGLPGHGLGGPLGFGGLTGYWGGYGGLTSPYLANYSWTGLAYEAPSSVQVVAAIPGIPVQVISGVTYQSLGGVLIQVVQ